MRWGERGRVLAGEALQAEGRGGRNGDGEAEAEGEGLRGGPSPIGAKKGLGAAVEGQATRVQGYEPGGPSRLVHVVSRVDNRYASGVEKVEKPEELGPGRRVEHSRRLVEGDAARLHSQGPGYSEALLLARGEKERGAFSLALQSDGLEGSIHPPANLLALQAEVLGTESHVLFDYGRDDLICRRLKNEGEGGADGPEILRPRGVEAKDPEPSGIGLLKAVEYS